MIFSIKTTFSIFFVVCIAMTTNVFGRSVYRQNIDSMVMVNTTYSYLEDFCQFNTVSDKYMNCSDSYGTYETALIPQIRKVVQKIIDQSITLDKALAIIENLDTRLQQLKNNTPQVRTKFIAELIQQELALFLTYYDDSLCISEGLNPTRDIMLRDLRDCQMPTNNTPVQPTQPIQAIQPIQPIQPIQAIQPTLVATINKGLSSLSPVQQISTTEQILLGSFTITTNKRVGIDFINLKNLGTATKTNFKNSSLTIQNDRGEKFFCILADEKVCSAQVFRDIQAGTHAYTVYGTPLYQDLEMHTVQLQLFNFGLKDYETGRTTIFTERLINSNIALIAQSGADGGHIPDSDNIQTKITYNTPTIMIEPGQKKILLGSITMINNSSQYYVGRAIKAFVKDIRVREGASIVVENSRETIMQGNLVSVYGDTFDMSYTTFLETNPGTSETAHVYMILPDNYQREGEKKLIVHFKQLIGNSGIKTPILDLGAYNANMMTYAISQKKPQEYVDCKIIDTGSNFLWNDGVTTSSQVRYSCKNRSGVGMYINTMQRTAGNVTIQFRIPISDYKFTYTTPAEGIEAEDLMNALYNKLLQIPEVTKYYAVGKSLVIRENWDGNNHLWVRLQSKYDDTDGLYSIELFNSTRTIPASMVQYQTHIRVIRQN